MVSNLVKLKSRSFRQSQRKSGDGGFDPVPTTSGEQNVAELVSQARKFANRGNHDRAARLFSKAADLARENLDSPKVVYSCWHNCYVQQLCLTKGLDVETIVRIIENLREMAANVDDDRLEHQLEPVIRFFETVHCASQLQDISYENIIDLVRRTDSKINPLDALSHILMDTIAVSSLLRQDRATVESSRIDLALQHLLKCLDEKTSYRNLPGNLREVLLEFRADLHGSVTHPEAASTAINKFQSDVMRPSGEYIGIASNVVQLCLPDVVQHSRRAKEVQTKGDGQKFGYIILLLAFLTLVASYLGILFSDIPESRVQATAGILALIVGIGCGAGVGCIIPGTAFAKGTIRLPLIGVEFSGVGGVGVMIITWLIAWKLLLSGHR